MKHRVLVPTSYAVLGLTVLTCSGMLASCAPARHARTSQQIEATQNIEDPIRVLEARAELETINPLPPVDDALIRRLLQDSMDALTPGTEAYRKALLRADQIELQSVPGLTLTAEEPEPISAQRQSHALKLYTRVRLLRQTGQLEQAIEGTLRAIEIDPNSALLHRTLGDTYSDLGDSFSADQAYTRAVELGDRSASTLVALASSAYARNDNQRVMSLCTTALQQPRTDDPVAQALAGIMLGNAQIRIGYLRAGAESLESALLGFSPENGNTRWRQQIIQIQGRRPALWVMIGDAWSRIGSHARAAEAYARAAELSNGSTGGLTSRRIAEHLREGHPATGALLLIDHVLKYTNDLSPQEGEWVEVLASLPSLNRTINDAIRSIRTQQPESRMQTRRALMGLEIRGLAPEDGLDRLASGGEDARNADAITTVLMSVTDADSRLKRAIELVDRNPVCVLEVADALLQLPASPSDVLGSLIADQDAVLLSAAMAQRMGRPDLLPEMELGGDAPELSNIELSILASVSAGDGRWDAAYSLVDELFQRADTGDIDAMRNSTSAAISLQDPERALRYAQRVATESQATTDDLLKLARVANTLGDYELARETLDRALVLAPSDTRIAEQLVRMHGVGGVFEDESTLREVIRRVGEAAPRSLFFAQLRAADLARNGLLGEAESLLIQLNEQRQGDIVGDDLLLSIWKTQETQGNTEALDRGAGWLAVRLSEYPAAIRAGLALAQIYYEREAYDDALSLLEQVRQQTRSMEVARVHEQLLNETGETEQALAYTDERIGTDGGIDAAIEYMQLLARFGGVEAIELKAIELARAVPEGIELYPTQVQQLSQIVFTLAERAETPGIDGPMLRVVNLIENRTGSLSFFMARTKILLLSRQPAKSLDLDELINIVSGYAAQFEDRSQQRQLESLPIQVLLGEDRGHEAISLVTRMGINNGEMRDDLVVETFRLLGAVGVSSDMLGVLDALEEAGMMSRVIELTTSRLGTPERPNQNLDADEQRADLAYTAGAMAAAFERNEESETFMRLAISFDEDHGWSNNDLGYLLLERGEKIDDAAQMLETAARVLPDQSNVIDSLGWLRYKQGIFEDEIDEMSGQVLRRGAISLLARANRLDNQRTNATILLHLGDAFWRANRKAQAIEAWVGGENMLRARLRVLGAQPSESRNQRAIDLISEELRTLRYRVQDAEAGGEPDIAPIFSEINGN
jgi:tetratricopeptide (TPR) repeat protein